MTNPAAGHNSVDSPMLNSYIERFYDCETDRLHHKEFGDEILAEAKSNGLDPATIRKLAKEKRETPSQRSKREEKETIEELYRHALGMTR